MEQTKEKLNSRSLLRWLQSLGLTYGGASALLRDALKDLQTLEWWEMDHLPLSDGIDDNLDVEKVILSSTGKPHQKVLAQKADWKRPDIFFISPAKYHSEDG